MTTTPPPAPLAMPPSDTDDDRLIAGIHRLYATLAPPSAPVLQPAVAPAEARPAAVRSRRRRDFATGALVLAAAALVVGGVVLHGGGSPGRTGSQPTADSLADLRVTVTGEGAGLSCQLPLYATSADQSVGFIDFSNGSAHFQPVRTTGNTYLAPLHRWVSAEAVSPNGLEWVQADVYQLDGHPQPAPSFSVMSGSGRMLHFSNADDEYSPQGWTSAGIVLLDQGNPTAVSGVPSGMYPGVRILNPTTGQLGPELRPDYSLVPTLTQGGSGWDFIAADDTLYINTEDQPNDTGNPTPTPTVPLQVESTITAFNLATGTSTQIWNGHQDGMGVAYVEAATASGEAIVQLSPTDIEHANPADIAGRTQITYLLTGLHQRVVLNRGTIGTRGVADTFTGVSFDQDGTIWLATNAGQIWRYQAATGLQQMASIRTSTQGAPGVQIVGGCD